MTTYTKTSDTGCGAGCDTSYYLKEGDDCYVLGAAEGDDLDGDGQGVACGSGYLEGNGW